MSRFVRWLVVFVAGMIAADLAISQRAAHASPVYGETPQGVQLGLALNQNVNWSGGSQTIYTCNNPNGFVALHVVARNPVGTQPVAFTVTVGTHTSANLTAANLTVSSTAITPSSPVVTGSFGDTIKIAPVVGTTGSITFDVIGYNLP